MPDLDTIIVTEETIKGGEAVNKIRKEKGLSVLKVIVTKVLGDSDTIDIGEKYSSSVIR